MPLFRGFWLDFQMYDIWLWFGVYLCLHLIISPALHRSVISCSKKLTTKNTYLLLCKTSTVMLSARNLFWASAAAAPDTATAVDQQRCNCRFRWWYKIHLNWRASIYGLWKKGLSGKEQRAPILTYSLRSLPATRVSHMIIPHIGILPALFAYKIFFTCQTSLDFSQTQMST